MSDAWKSFATSAPRNPNLSNFSQFDELVNRLLNRQAFQISRFNDGEWVFALKIEPYYSNYITRSNYSRTEIDEIGKKLLKVIDNKPDYFIGIDSSTLAGMGSIKTHFALLKKKISNLRVVYGEIFNAATVKYGLSALTNPLKNRWVLTIGPEYMKKLNLQSFHISVPSKSCWIQADSIEKQLEQAISSNLEKQPVILYSCSLLAKWLIDVMYHKFGDKITQLDIGSCVDPWCGFNSRPWHNAVAKEYNLGTLQQITHNGNLIFPALPKPAPVEIDIENFNEELYLQKYKDVAKAVQLGIMPSGKWHYIKYGKNEGRKL